MKETVEERLRKEQLNDIKYLLETENNRRFLWRVLSHCGIYRDIHTDDESTTNRKLGQRSIGLWILQLISEADEDKVFKMMKEAKEHDTLYARLSEEEEKRLNGEGPLGVEEFI